METHNPPQYSDKELLEIFPEAKKIIPQKIKECKEEIKKREQEIGAALNEIYALETDEFSERFGEEVIKMHMMPVLNKLERDLFKLERLKCLIRPKKAMNKRIEFGAKIDNAKKFPIEELARNKLAIKSRGRNFISLCPLHNEKTPSFYIYPETNRFYCFGCQEKGDVINLTMVLYGVEFKEAVEMLQN